MFGRSKMTFCGCFQSAMYCDMSFMYVYEIPRSLGSSVEVRKISVSPKYLESFAQPYSFDDPATQEQVHCRPDTHMMDSRSNCLPCDVTVRFITTVLLSPTHEGGV